MSWNTFISVAGIKSKRFADYQSALDHFNSIKPIRGRSPEVRPIGEYAGARKHYSHCKIDYKEGDVGGVSAILYNTECVRIQQDGGIVIQNGGWTTTSTVNFVYAVLPSKFGSVRLHKGDMVYREPTGKEYIVPKEGITLQASPDWSTATVNLSKTKSEAQYTYAVDRKAMNKAMEPYKPFLALVKTMSAITPTYNIAEVAEYFPEVITDFVDTKNKHEEAVRESKATGVASRSYYDEEWSLLQCIGRNIRSFAMPQHPKYSYPHTAKDLTTILTLARSQDSTDLRKAMIWVAMVAQQMARESTRGNLSDDNVKVDTLFGEVEVPNITFTVSGSVITKWFRDIVKSMYAQSVFKKVDTPLGVVRTESMSCAWKEYIDNAMNKTNAVTQEV